jgi:hypothetical protein
MRRRAMECTCRWVDMTPNAISQGRFAVAGSFALLIILVLLSGSCAHSVATHPLEGVAVIKSREQIQILYYWGVGARNRLDTMSGTVTVDCIPPLTGPFILEERDRTAIVALADSMGFFSLPVAPVPPASDTTRMRTPCSSFVLRITDAGRSHTVVWDDCLCNPCEERDRAAAVGTRIKSLITRTAAYKQLWRSCARHPFYI